MTTVNDINLKIKLDKNNIIKYLSGSRIDQYIDYCNGDYDTALKLYQLNLRLASAFLPLISMLEVSLRNTIDYEMSKIYPDKKNQNWIDQLEFEILIRINAKLIHRKDFNLILSKIKKSKQGILNKIEKNIKNYLKRKLRKSIDFKKMSKQERENKVNQILYAIKQDKGLEVKRHVVIANMDFSFWTSFFHKKVFGLLGSNVIHVFVNNNPKKNIDRNYLSSRLEKIRMFRNRIAHNEPVIFSKQNYNIRMPEVVKRDILDILKLLNEDLNKYSQDIHLINVNLQKVEDYCLEINKMIKKPARNKA